MGRVAVAAFVDDHPEPFAGGGPRRRRAIADAAFDGGRGVAPDDLEALAVADGGGDGLARRDLIGHRRDPDLVRDRGAGG